jgi:hypothetical protein
MTPIQLTDKEQHLLKARKAALDVAVQTIAELHDANTPGWMFSEDFSTLNPPQSSIPANMNQPEPPKA